MSEPASLVRPRKPIGIWHAAQAAGGSLSLACVPDRLMRMLTLTGVDSLLPVHATAADAVAAVTDSPPTSANRQKTPSLPVAVVPQSSGGRPATCPAW